MIGDAKEGPRAGGFMKQNLNRVLPLESSCPLGLINLGYLPVSQD